MFNIMCCNNKLIEESLKNIDSKKHKSALREIYDTLFNNRDFSKISKYFTNEFYVNCSKWDMILGRSSFDSTKCNANKALKDLMIYVKNIKTCSEEVTRNFCDFVILSHIIMLKCIFKILISS